MPMPRYNAKRDENEIDIVNTLKDFGADVFRIHAPCDLLVGYGGITHTVEVKTRKGKLTKGQKLFADHWSGAPLVVLRSTIDAEEFMKRLRKQKAD